MPDKTSLITKSDFGMHKTVTKKVLKTLNSRWIIIETTKSLQFRR